MVCHIVVDNTPTFIGEDNEHEQRLEGRRRDGEEVTGYEVCDVVV